MHIGEISIQLPTAPIRTTRRNELINDIYALYISQPEITQKENRRRYHEFVRLRHPEVCRKAGFSKAAYDSYKDEFRKARLPKEQKFIPYEKPDRFWRHFVHLKGEEGTAALNHIISVAKDKKWRGENVARYIIGCVKSKEQENP